MKGMQYSPRKIVTDKLRSYAAALIANPVLLP